MTIKVPKEAIEKLADGEKVEITHWTLGADGYNGRVVLQMADEDENYTADWR